MSLLERHRYMIHCIAEAFEFPEDDIEEMMLEPDVINRIDNFFSADGPTKILFTIIGTENYISNSKPQTPKVAQANTPKNDKVKVTTTSLKVYVDSVDIIPSTAVYFMKNKKGNRNNINYENSDKYTIDPHKKQDGTLSFGVVRAPLESLEVMMRCVYKPMIQEMNTDSWGRASTEQKHDFFNGIDTFTKGLQESIRSISGGLELSKPDERIETLGTMAAASDPSIVMGSLNLLQDWCTKIEKYLDESSRSRWETPDSGPDTELNYWRSRMQR